jgi:hypothetical protein
MKQRYVIVRGQVCRWEDKAPFVPSGKSLHGVLEHDRDSDMLKCHECGEWYASLAQHVSDQHGVTTRAYKFRHGLRLSTSLNSFATQAALRTAWLNQNLKPHKSNKLQKPHKPHKPHKPYPRRPMWELRNQKAQCEAQLAVNCRNLAEVLGRMPKGKDFEEAGIPIRVGGEKRRVSKLRQLASGAYLPTRYTKEILAELLRDFYVLNKRLPHNKDFTSGLLPPSGTFTKYFGSMAAAWKAAGLSIVAAKELRSGVSKEALAA